MPWLAMRQPKHIPKGAAGDDQQSEAQQENQNVLASFSGPAKGGRIRKHAVDPDRIGDVLDFAISEQLISANQLVLDLLVNGARDVNLARLGKPLEPQATIDPTPLNLRCFLDNAPNI